MPMTRIKIIIAGFLYRILRMVLRTDNHIIRRKKICYAVDLSEGIDLSIYLFAFIYKYGRNGSVMVILMNKV